MLCLAIVLTECPVFAFTDQNNDGMIVRLIPPPGREWVIRPGNPPDTVMVCTGYPLRDLMDNQSDWRYTRSVIDYFGYYSWILDAQFSDWELAGYFDQFVAWDLEFDLGVMAIKDECPWWYTGEQCYAVESARWNRFSSLGADIASLNIDEPYTATVRGNLGATVRPHIPNLDYAVRETADWLELTRADSVIGMKPIALIEAYPYITKEKLIEFIDELGAECDERGIAGIDALVIDHNWAGFGGQTYWEGLLYLENYCQSSGLKFSMIFWPARSYNYDDSDWDFYIDIMYQGNTYFNTYGGSPDMVDVMAWDWIPRVMVPEALSGPVPITLCPFTYSFLAFYNTYINSGSDGHESFKQERIAPAITTLSPNPSSSDVTIEFHCPTQSSGGSFQVFDVVGRVVRTEDMGPTGVGDHMLTWDGCSSTGEPVSTGVYFVRITFDDLATDTSRLLVVK